MSSTLTAIQARLTTTSTLLLERSRVISLNLPPSASSTAQIVRNFTSLRNDLVKLEDEVELEVAGLAVGGKKGRGKNKQVEGELGQAVREAGERYDRLLEMFEEDDIGREKAKALQREVKQPPSLPETPKLDTELEEVERNGVPKVNVEPPTPAVEGPFRDYPDDDEDEVDKSGINGSRTPQEMLQDQQELMDDQDERLNHLSNSIGRQNHLSIQIGSELDLHHDLLEDTDAAMDRTAVRLNRAKRRLDKVAGDAKQYGSTLTIVGLIFVLLILIIVFKT